MSYRKLNGIIIHVYLEQLLGYKFTTKWNRTRVKTVAQLSTSISKDTHKEKRGSSFEYTYESSYWLVRNICISFKVNATVLKLNQTMFFYTCSYDQLMLVYVHMQLLSTSMPSKSKDWQYDTNHTNAIPPSTMMDMIFEKLTHQILQVTLWILYAAAQRLKIPHPWLCISLRGLDRGWHVRWTRKAFVWRPAWHCGGKGRRPWLSSV